MKLVSHYIKLLLKGRIYLISQTSIYCDWQIINKQDDEANVNND